jgi:pyrroloquinoline quinone (PQQ) biosynthesis protein C
MNPPTYEATIRSRSAQADRLAGELADLEAGGGWERHPFLRRWRAGELSAGELQAFAAEHHAAVVALAHGARAAAAMTDGLLAEQLSRYAVEQERAVELSCAFAVASGWGRSAWYFAQDPLEPTRACARAWSGEGHTLAERLTGLVVIESALGRVAADLLDALILRYALFDGRATGYFARCAERCADDAAMLGAGLASVLPLAAPAELVRHADMVLGAYSALLDGVQRVSPALS